MKIHYSRGKGRDGEGREGGGKEREGGGEGEGRGGKWRGRGHVPSPSTCKLANHTFMRVPDLKMISIHILTIIKYGCFYRHFTNILAFRLKDCFPYIELNKIPFIECMVTIYQWTMVFYNNTYSVFIIVVWL